MNRSGIYGECIKHIQKLRYYWLLVNGFNEDVLLTVKALIFANPRVFKIEELNKTIISYGGDVTFYKFKILKQRIIAAEDKDDFFHNYVPTDDLLDIAMEFEIVDWCQYALENDPVLAHLDTSYKREQENFHELNSILGTQ